MPRARSCSPGVQQDIWDTWPCVWAFVPQCRAGPPDPGVRRQPGAHQLLRPLVQSGWRPEPMLTYVLKRPRTEPAHVFLTVSTVFVLIRMAPGDPAYALTPGRWPPPETSTKSGISHGPQRASCWSQYWHLPAGAAHRQPGHSPTRSRRRRCDVVLRALPYTITLATCRHPADHRRRHPAGRLDGHAGRTPAASSASTC